MNKERYFQRLRWKIRTEVWKNNKYSENSLVDSKDVMNVVFFAIADKDH